MKKITISILPFLQSSSIINLEQKYLAFQQALVPLSVTIHAQKHGISTTIGAQRERFYFFIIIQKNKNGCQKIVLQNPKITSGCPKLVSGHYFLFGRPILLGET
jgi:hypothetical protein